MRKREERESKPSSSGNKYCRARGANATTYGRKLLLVLIEKNKNYGSNKKEANNLRIKISGPSGVIDYRG